MTRRKKFKKTGIVMIKKNLKTGARRVEHLDANVRWRNPSDPDWVVIWAGNPEDLQKALNGTRGNVQSSGVPYPQD